MKKNYNFTFNDQGLVRRHISININALNYYNNGSVPIGIGVFLNNLFTSLSLYDPIIERKGTDSGFHFNLDYSNVIIGEKYE